MTAKIEYLPQIKASVAAMLEDARQSITDESPPMIIIWQDKDGVSWIQSGQEKDLSWMAQRFLVNLHK